MAFLTVKVGESGVGKRGQTTLPFVLLAPGGDLPPPPPPPTDTTAPSVPTGLAGSITGASANQASLSWNPATDNVAVASYRVYRNGLLVAAPAGTSVTVLGLAYATTHNFTVSAVDAAGNESAKSMPLALVTGADPSGTFDPRTYDYDALAAPRAAATSARTAPVAQYAGSTGGRPHATQGPLQLVDIEPAVTYDPTLKSQSTDLATGVTARGDGTDTSGVLIEDCYVGASVKSLGGVQDIRNSIVDDTVSIAPAPGALSGGAVKVKDSDIVGTQDGTWIGDTTRVWLFDRYDRGDFSSPFVSHITRSRIRAVDRKCGMASYSPTFQNRSADPDNYPGVETVGTMALPMNRAQYDASLIASKTVTTAAHVGDFVGAPPGVPMPTGLSGVRWQVIGTTGGDRSPGAACTIGQFVDYNVAGGWTTDGGGILKFDRTVAGREKYIFVPAGGNAILLYIGWLLHGDANQMGKAHGHTLWYRTRMEGFTNAGWLICQATNGPFTGQDAFDVAGWPTSYIHAEQCDITVGPTGKIAFLQSAADPATNDYPAWGWKAFPWWATLKDSYIIRTNGVEPSGNGLLYAKDEVRVPMIVSSQAKRWTGVLAQLDSTGVNALTTANGGVMPTGAQMVESIDSDPSSATFGQIIPNPLAVLYRELEYQQHVLIPTDGRFGTPDNRLIAPFAARKVAGIRDTALDARGWVVWDNVRNRLTDAPVHPVWPNPSKRPWLDPTGADNGYYSKAA